MGTIETKKIVQKALREDLAWGDITSELTIPEESKSSAKLTAKSDSVVCGLEFFKTAFLLLDSGIIFEGELPDGTFVKKGDIVVSIYGKTRPMLAAERTALNFFNHLSGIATLTRSITEKVSSTNCRITDTRKTLPLLRAAQRYAVTVGGGVNHRMDLSSSVLIKDNHLRAVGSVSKAVILAKQKAPHVMKVEVEVTNLAEAKEAFESGADIVMLDNMTPDQIKEIVKIAPKNVILEASGKITAENCLEYAKTGVHVISMGSLTHSAKSSDFSLEFD